MPRTCTALLFIAVAIGGSGDVAAQAYLSPVGYTELQARLGSSTPNGAGVWVAMVEAGGADSYAPDPVVAIGRQGFSITQLSGASGFNPHATAVADNFFGNTSMAKGITRVDSWNTNEWLMSGFLSSAGGLPPISNIPKVSNHSYAGSAGASYDAYLRRVDYLADRGGKSWWRRREHRPTP